MPPVNQQRSATGLIVALVAFVIMFVVAAVLAMNYNNQFKLEHNTFEAYKLNYNQIVPEGTVNSQNIIDLKAARGTDQRFGITQNDAVVDVATKQRDALIAQIMGSTGTNTTAVTVDKVASTLKETQAAIDAAGLGVKLDMSSPNLLAAITVLEKKAADLAGESKTWHDKYDDDAKGRATDQAATAAATKAYTEDVSKLASTDAATVSQKDASNTASQAAVDKVTADNAALTKQIADATAKATADEATFKHELAANRLLISSLQAKLGNRRMDSSQSIVTQIDGKIIRAAGKDVCYINIGQGKQISPGLTFEVYERTEGVPPIPPNTGGDDHLPIGKASIEVTSVGPESSECRVVHLEPGAVLTEGDVIANLVYDPNTKFNFFVYGNFDMGQSGRPSAADADVIRRLITQWGGQLTDKIDVNTDFVVLGAEPQIPSYTKEELEDPGNQKHLTDAQAELDKYGALRETAIEYHIPIMNQNRFLYYVGFYDQSKR